MLFARVKRTDPEKVFVIALNSWSSAGLTNGQAVQWDFLTDVNGVGVSRPTARATNAGLATAGIVAEAIASGSYGLIQVWGYHAAVKARACTTGNAIAKGSPLIVNLAGSVFCLESVGTNSSTAQVGTHFFPCAFAMEAYTSWTTTTIKAFIKAL